MDTATHPSRSIPEQADATVAADSARRPHAGGRGADARWRPLPSRRRRDRPAVMALVLLVTFVDIAALVAVTLGMPIEPAIAFPGIGDPDLAIVVGLVFWTAIALLGSLQAISLHGHGVLTFHMPFIIAATALGGPVAGGWVALIGTFERRELRTAPWYGTVYNHVVLSLAAVIAGLGMLVVRDALSVVGYDSQVILLLSLAAATIVFALVSTGLVVVAVTLRDDLQPSEAIEIQVRSYRDTAAAEAIMGWLLAWVYLSIAPWAPIVVFIALLAIWRKTRAADAAEWDVLTNVASRAHVMRVLESARKGVRDGGSPISVLYIDLDGLKRLNDSEGHAYGDVLLRTVGERLRAQLRLVDLPGRLGGDEFIVVLRDIADEDELLAIAWRIHAALAEPIAALPDFAPGASIGALHVDATYAGSDASILVATADCAMYVAKKGRLGVQLASEENLAGAIKQRRDADRKRRELGGMERLEARAAAF